MSNWTYFCLFAINICKAHYPFDISLGIAHTLFSAKCLPSLLGSCNYLFGRRPSQSFRAITNFKQLIPNFCWCCCYIHLSRGRRNKASLSYRKIWMAWHLVKKIIVMEKQVVLWSYCFLFINSMVTAWPRSAKGATYSVWILILVLSFLSCVAVGKFLKHPVPQIPHQWYNQDNNTT